MLLHLTKLEYANIALILAIIVILYRYIESYWSYKISKPYLWTQGINNKNVTKALSKLEYNYNDKVRFYNFWFQIERIKKENIFGDFVELGVYQGKTAKIIHEMAPERDFYLFDTFNGFSKTDLELEDKEVDDNTAKLFSNSSLEKVKLYLEEKSENIIFCPGYFPESTKGIEDCNFAFVHLDADLYAPTLAGLKYFFPKLSPGGVIMIHDYNHNWEGVKKAINEFMPTIAESLIELPDLHGSVMIIKNK